jgi:hypothetical protein
MPVRTTFGQMAFIVIFSSGRYLPYERTKPITPLFHDQRANQKEEMNTYCFEAVYIGNVGMQ